MKSRALRRTSWRKVPDWHNRQMASDAMPRQLLDTGRYPDGYYKPLLPYLNDIPHDGIEALTPLPQGDVSLEETAEFVRDKVVLDGIPAVLFLPTYPMEQLQECTEKLVDLFGSRLILGISDEMPEGAPPDSIERVRWVADYCRSRQAVRR